MTIKGVIGITAFIILLGTVGALENDFIGVGQALLQGVLASVVLAICTIKKSPKERTLQIRRQSKNLYVDCTPKAYYLSRERI